jgi:hypothetical protein
VFSTNISSAALFRVIELYHPTLLLDEAEAYARGERGADTQLVLNSGYRKGQKAIRCETGGNGEVKVKSFDVYGPKALAGTGGLSPTLLSRCICVHMERKTRRIRLFVDEEWARRLRGKLTYYQFHRNGGLSVGEDKLEALGGTRLAELILPLMRIAPTREIQDRIYKYAVNLAGRRREEETASDEAITVKAIADLYYGNSQRQTVIPVRLITEKVLELEEAYSERDRVSWSRRIGRITGRLGFHKTRPQGKSMVKVSEPLLKRLMVRYLFQELTTYFPMGAETTLNDSMVVGGSALEKPHLTPQTQPNIGDEKNNVNLSGNALESLNLNDFQNAKEHPGKVCEVRLGFPQPQLSEEQHRGPYGLFECPQCRFKAFTEADLKAHEAYHRGLNGGEQTSKVSMLKARLLKLVNSRSPLLLNEAIRMLMGEGMSEDEAMDFLIDHLSEEAMPLHGENGECYLVPSDHYEDYKSTINKRNSHI